MCNFMLLAALRAVGTLVAALPIDHGPNIESDGCGIAFDAENNAQTIELVTRQECGRLMDKMFGARVREGCHCRFYAGPCQMHGPWADVIGPAHITFPTKCSRYDCSISSDHKEPDIKAKDTAEIVKFDKKRGVDEGIVGWARIDINGDYTYMPMEDTSTTLDCPGLQGPILTFSVNAGYVCLVFDDPSCSKWPVGWKQGPGKDNVIGKNARWYMCEKMAVKVPTKERDVAILPPSARPRSRDEVGSISHGLQPRWAVIPCLAKDQAGTLYDMNSLRECQHLGASMAWYSIGREYQCVFYDNDGCYENENTLWETGPTKDYYYGHANLAHYVCRYTGVGSETHLDKPQPLSVRPRGDLSDNYNTGYPGYLQDENGGMSYMNAYSGCQVFGRPIGSWDIKANFDCQFFDNDVCDVNQNTRWEIGPDTRRVYGDAPLIAYNCVYSGNDKKLRKARALHNHTNTTAQASSKTPNENASSESGLGWFNQNGNIFAKPFYQVSSCTDMGHGLEVFMVFAGWVCRFYDGANKCEESHNMMVVQGPLQGEPVGADYRWYDCDRLRQTVAENEPSQPFANTGHALQVHDGRVVKVIKDGSLVKKSTGNVENSKDDIIVGIATFTNRQYQLLVDTSASGKCLEMANPVTKWTLDEGYYCNFYNTPNCDGQPAVWLKGPAHGEIPQDNQGILKWYKCGSHFSASSARGINLQLLAVEAKQDLVARSPNIDRFEGIPPIRGAIEEPGMISLKTRDFQWPYRCGTAGGGGIFWIEPDICPRTLEIVTKFEVYDRCTCYFYDGGNCFAPNGARIVGPYLGDATGHNWQWYYCIMK